MSPSLSLFGRVIHDPPHVIYVHVYRLHGHKRSSINIRRESLILEFTIANLAMNLR